MKISTRRMVVAGVLGGLTAALGFMPVGGFIPVPTPAGSATTMHLPAILAGILEGPLVGALVGLVFGAFSFYRALTAPPNPVAQMMFSNPLIAFLPRMLIGVVSHWAFSLAEGVAGRIFLAAGGGAVLGSTVYWALGEIAPGAVTETARALLSAVFGVFGACLLWLMSTRRKAGAPLAALAGSLTNTLGVLGLSAAFGYLPVAAAVSVGVIHGIPEALVAMVLVTAVYSGVAAGTGYRK